MDTDSSELQIPDRVGTADLLKRLVPEQDLEFGPSLIKHIEAVLAAELAIDVSEDAGPEAQRVTLQLLREKIVAIVNVHQPDFGNGILNEGLSLFGELLSEAYALTSTDPSVPENQYRPNHISALAKLQNALTVLKLVLKK